MVGPDHGGQGLVEEDGQGEVVGEDGRGAGPVGHPEDQEVGEEEEGDAEEEPGPPPAPRGLGPVREVAEEGVVHRVPEGVDRPGQGVEGGGEAEPLQVEEGEVGAEAFGDKGQAELSRGVAPLLHRPGLLKKGPPAPRAR